MLIVWVFLHIKSLPNLLFVVLCLPGDQSHPFAQPTINPLACCICWAGLLAPAVFPPWNEGPNFGSYSPIHLSLLSLHWSSQSLSFRNLFFAHHFILNSLFISISLTALSSSSASWEKAIPWTKSKQRTCKKKPGFEVEQDPMVLKPHVLFLSFVCGKTLTKK